MNLFLVSCEKTDKEDDFTIYKISKGSHESTPNKIEFSRSQKLEFLVIFDSTAICKTYDTADQHDINKLYGFTDCNSSVHQNSARFGWRWYENQLQLCSYTYVNGDRSSKTLIPININEETKCCISITNGKYYYYIDNQLLDSIDKSCADDTLKKFICYPYYGGNETAPHNITIKIKDL